MLDLLDCLFTRGTHSGIRDGDSEQDSAFQARSFLGYLGGSSATFIQQFPTYLDNGVANATWTGFLLLFKRQFVNYVA